MSIEDTARVRFQFQAATKIGEDILRAHLDQRVDGSDVAPDHGYVIGEVPCEGTPGQVVLSKDEIDPPGPRLQPIIDSVAEHNLRTKDRERRKRIVIIGSAGVGLIALGIGTYFALKHYTDADPKADITK